MSYVAIADATTNLPTRFWDEVAFLPMDITAGGETLTYCNDWPDEKITDFYKKLRGGLTASTAQVAPLIYEEAFEKALQAGQDVLYLCFSSGMSGTISAAVITAKELMEKYPDRVIECVDSGCATLSEGMMVMELLKNRAAGMGVRENAEALRAKALSFASWFTVEDLMYLKRGGRISSFSAIVGSTLHIMPVMHIDTQGRLVVVDKVQGRKAALKAIAKKMKEIWTPEVDQTVLIGHCDAQADAEFLEMAVLSLMPQAQIEISSISPVIGAHSGPGTVAIFFRTKER